MTKFSAAQQSQLAQIGAFLRENREKQEKSLEDIAIRTYIRPQLLNGIEQGNPDVLPEPIFVQGFIRRYAESLGLRGVELSQQFTVTSIPSTPRPARSAEPQSNSTRLLSREVGTTSAVSTPLATTTDVTTTDAPPMFTPSSDAPAENVPIQASTPQTSTTQTSTAPVATPSAEIPLLVDDAVAANSVEPADDAFASEDFASKVAAFDQQNLEETPTLETADIPLGAAIEQKPLERVSEAPLIPDAPSVSEAPTIPEMPVVTPNFDDGLPDEFTTQVAADAPIAAPQPPRPVYSPDPVGIEYGSESPNLKPFAIGAVIAAAIVAGLILLVNMLGGGDRTPDVATDTDTEQVEPVTPESDLPPVPAEPVAQEPPASTQPVYVEAEATAETYVSVNVDGVNVYEGTMQPGETLLWEAQAEIDVYSGNAGGLTISANGGEAKVLGESGQLGQQVFTEPES